MTMEKTVFLYVRDDGDYGAVSFESQYKAQKVYEEMLAEGITRKDLPNLEDEGWAITVEIKEFGSVDPEFEFFVLDTLCDYDQLKAANIYRVEPSK
jgi:hypothetical protein